MNGSILERLSRIQFCLLLFALPFEYYFAGHEHALLSTLKLQVVLLGATWIAGQPFERAHFRPVRSRPFIKALSSDRLVLAVVIFVVVQLAASAFAPVYRANAWTAGFKTAIGACIALMAAGLGMSFREERRPHLLLVLVTLSGTCVALLGFGERAGIGVFTWIVNLFQPSRYFLGNHLRLVSTMEYPNTTGSFLSVSICATLALLMFPATSPLRRWRPAYVVVLVLQTVALTLTYSRGAMGAAILGIVTATWAVRRSGWDRSWHFPLIFCLVLLISGMTYLSLVRRTAEVEKPIVSKRVAHFGLDAGEQKKALQAGTSYFQTIAVQNQSSDVWRHGEQGLAYRWYSFQAKRRSPLFEAAAFPVDIPPADSRKLPVTLRTPDEAGQYLLIWFVFVREDGIRELEDSFSPGIMCFIGPTTQPPPTPAGTSALQYTGAIQEERRLLNAALVPGRWELWSAALKMLRQRPLLGMGPDNFRILKWRYMDLPKGDETILANSLYLELLAGSGILGLVSFLWLSWELARRMMASAAVADRSTRGIAFFGMTYLAAFLLHGMVDYFLKFTPTFLLFWLVLGTLSRRAQQGGTLEAGV